MIKMNNGTTKLILADGTIDIRFDNGDLKRVKGDVTVYYYNDVETLFTSTPVLGENGLVKIYRFGNG